MLLIVDVLLLFVGIAIGVALGWFAARSRASSEIARLDATLQATRDGEARLEQSLRTLTYEATEQSQAAVSEAVAPLHDALARYEQRVGQLERDRVGAYEALREQVRNMSEVSGQLRAPQVRGRWGEHQLRRIVEAAGMLEHCDFSEQVSGVTDAGGVRPDLVVRLHGGRQVVVDAKVPFEGYLAAMEADDDIKRDHHLLQHARQLRAHVDQLAAKSYWEAFEPAPEFVVLFVPADPFLDAAIKREPTLLEYAFARNVVLATPSTLVALLRTVAYAWRQEALARNAITVHQQARELYGRLSTMGDHLAKVGTSLGASVTAYNRAIGSLEARVLVSARRLADLGVSGSEIPAPAQVEVAPRALQAPELVDSEYEALLGDQPPY
jgi:DNA recombination protein RmuC